MAKSLAAFRELSVDELRSKERELDDQLFRLRIQKSMGQLEAPLKVRTVRRDLARVKTLLRQKNGYREMSKAEKLGRCERQDDQHGRGRHRTCRAPRTLRQGAASHTKFMAHDDRAPKTGDQVAIVESRPLSKTQALGRDARRAQGHEGLRGTP
jgi:large subunit ribosomal protein L29